MVYMFQIKEVSFVYTRECGMDKRAASRLSMYLPKVVHMALKQISEEQRCTITSYVLGAILERIKKENVDR